MLVRSCTRTQDFAIFLFLLNRIHSPFQSFAILLFFFCFSISPTHTHTQPPRQLETSAQFALGTFGSLWARYCSLEETIWYSLERAEETDHKRFSARRSYRTAPCNLRQMVILCGFAFWILPKSNNNGAHLWHFFKGTKNK